MRIRSGTSKRRTLSGRLETIAQFEQWTEFTNVFLQLSFRIIARKTQLDIVSIERLRWILPFRGDSEENDLSLIEIIAKVFFQRIWELFQVE